MFDQPIEMNNAFQRGFELAFAMKDMEEIKRLNNLWFAVVRGL